jgi:hypothetical protein
MDKFLDTPVDGETNMLISCSDVIAVTKTSTTKTTLTYNSGNTVELEHAAEAFVNEMRDDVQDAMEEALKTSWTDVAFAWVPKKVISAVVVA